jgi:outer membrane protein assembly factor BamE (lipoprotein component of BamABCDE complex)|tara:strand:- start:1009 stop:1425 length:417 start_codon:yes stop_codon:yes gene_type:complete
MKKLLLALSLTLTACAGTTQIHGSLIKPADVDKLRIGIHTKNDVVGLLGSPTTISTLNQEKWYYITDTKVTEPLKKPYLKERQVFAVSFNKDGKLDKIFEKDESYSKTFKVEEETTKTQGQKFGIIDQIYYTLTSGFN